jgi:hypothetical protein
MGNVRPRKVGVDLLWRQSRHRYLYFHPAALHGLVRAGLGCRYHTISDFRPKAGPAIPHRALLRGSRSVKLDCARP